MDEGVLRPDEGALRPGEGVLRLGAGALRLAAGAQQPAAAGVVRFRLASLTLCLALVVFGGRPARHRPQNPMHGSVGRLPMWESPTRRCWASRVPRKAIASGGDAEWSIRGGQLGGRRPAPRGTILAKQGISKPDNDPARRWRPPGGFAMCRRRSRCGGRSRMGIFQTSDSLPSQRWTAAALLNQWNLCPLM